METALPDISLATAAWDALGILFSWERMGFLSLGVIIGLIVGVIPGLGGLVGLSLLLPFTFDMNAYTALAFLMGLQAVTVTSDTIPAVMFGVPGTVGSAATILDGSPMARKGEAGRAYGAAFTASVVGGLWGALLLGVSIPILRPVMLHIGSPELLSFCVFGLSLASVLSGGSLLKGLAGACIGILVKTAGDDPQTGTLRWTFDSLYLWDGLPVVPLALGLFAIPELADLAIQQKSIAADPDQMKKSKSTRKDQLIGVRDVMQNWWLVVRCATIGAGLGAVPGIGASVVDWIAYGHAARTEKGAAQSFGKGDVRGVIASESSNNAKEGGALVPTIAFGVPGSASMALILGAFLIHGLVPGPEMVTKKLDVTYTMVWSVAFANLIGAGICFAFADQLAKLALIRPGLLVPIVLAVVFVGAFQGSRQWGDIYALLGFGLLGFVMKRLRWPRPPLVLGFVLGGLIERYMFISVERYGAQWTYDITEFPIVVVMFIITAYGIMFPLIKDWNERRKAKATGDAEVITRKYGFRKEGLDFDLAFGVGLMILFVIELSIASTWEFGARLVPQVIGYLALVILTFFVFAKLFVSREVKVPDHIDPDTIEAKTDVHFDIVVDFGDIGLDTIWRRALAYFGWCAAFFLGAAIIGLLPAMFFFLVGYMRLWGKATWTVTLGIAVPLWAFCYFLFHQILIIPWPQSVVGDTWPVLRTINWANLF